MAQVCLRSVKKGFSCSYPKVGQVSISSLGSAPWHHQHGLTAAALLEKPPAKTISYFHGILRKNPQASCFQLGNWNSNPSSLPTLASCLTSPGHLPSSQGGSEGCTGSAAQPATGRILLTNKPRVSHQSESRSYVFPS